MADKILEPFDGDVPDRLVDEFADQLTILATEFEPLIEKARSLGCTALLLMSACDPLTGYTSMVTKQAHWDGEMFPCKE